MFEWMTVGEMLHDLRSVKVPKTTRAYIDRARICFESNGSIPAKVQFEIKRICQRFSAQLKELHAARERARQTNGRIKLGLSKEDVVQRIADRKAAEENARNDLGF